MLQVIVADMASALRLRVQRRKKVPYGMQSGRMIADTAADRSDAQ